MESVLVFSQSSHHTSKSSSATNSNVCSMFVSMPDDMSSCNICHRAEATYSSMCSVISVRKLHYQIA